MFNNGFGDDGQRFPFDEDEPMGNQNSAVDENMNDIMDIPDMPDIPDLQPIQSPHVDTTQPSKEQPTQHSTHDASGNGNTTNRLGETTLLSLSSSIVVQKRKSKKRRTTILLDEETIIPSKIMKARISE